ncbi:MAG: uracil-xanthine permease family protein [Desulfovibrio sp.]|uniref:uracil-xanthine permease family protein n=1 Tax=Desulfovibrio sp. 7SRBS1 TaxID=3378064 RepID=UPI003B3F5C76
MPQQYGEVVYGPADHPPLRQTLVRAFLHVLLVYGGIALIPVMIGRVHNVPAAQITFVTFTTALCCALSIVLQALRIGPFGSGHVLFMGTSGAYLSSASMAVGMGGFPLMAGMVLLAAPFQFLFGYFFHFLRKIVTPQVGGVVIMLAVVGMLKHAMSTWTGQSTDPLCGSPAYMLVGLVTAATILLQEFFGGKRLRMWCIPIGIIAGYITSGMFGILKLNDVISEPFFGLPSGHWPGVEFSMSSDHLVLYLTFVVATLAESIKYTGDSMAVQRVSRPNIKKTDYGCLQGGLYADALGKVACGLIGALPNQVHTPNIPMLQMTGSASRRVAYFGAAIIVLLALSPKFTALTVDMPAPVLGATGVILVCHLFATGMKMAAGDSLNFKSGLMIGLSLCAGIVTQYGLFFPNLIPDYLRPFATNGAAVGGMCAFFLSALMRLDFRRRHVFKGRAELDMLPGLVAVTDKAAEDFALSERAASFLTLACEEVFMHFIETAERASSPVVTITIRRGNGRLDIIAECGATAADMDETLATAIRRARLNVEPKALGLYLLAKVAGNVSQAAISGRTYIEFTLPIR